MQSIPNHWLNNLINDLRDQEQLIKKGGGDQRAEKEHQKGKLIARERISELIDIDTEFFEFGTLGRVRNV